MDKHKTRDEPSYNILKQNVRSYNYILRNNIKQAEQLHYHKCFQNFKTNMKKPGHSLTKCSIKLKRKYRFHDFLL